MTNSPPTLVRDRMTFAEHVTHLRAEGAYEVLASATALETAGREIIDRLGKIQVGAGEANVLGRRRIGCDIAIHSRS